MEVPSGGEKYRLVREIGKGGMGVVYEAWDLRLDRRVAVKYLNPRFTADAESLARVEREARNAARVEHPNVVRVYGMTSVEGQLVIEMQYIEGAPLHTILAAGKLAPAVAADLLRQFLEALEACHGHGVIHCDLKPGNLLVTPQGQLYLTDFGISQSIRSEGDWRSAERGPLWGTPRYSPPEAWRGEKPDPRWDLYSAGAVIHEVLSGKSFQDTCTPGMTTKSLPESTSPSLAELAPDLSPGLSDLIADLTARDPQERPGSARAALDRLIEIPELKQRESGKDTFAKLFLRLDAAEETTKVVSQSQVMVHPFWRRLRVALVLLMVGGVLGVGFYTRNGRSPREEEANPRPATSSTAPGAARVAPVTTAGAKTINSRLVSTSAGVCFAYDDGVHGNELWFCGFGNLHMTLLKDIVPGPGSSNPRNFLSRESANFLFAASTPETGEELWSALLEYDGSARDIRQVMDILPGPMGSEPLPQVSLQSTVLFEAKTLAFGHELWCTNTRPGQTAITADLAEGPSNSVPMQSRLATDDSGAYMIAYNLDGMRLWRYDIASNTVREIAPVDLDSNIAAVDGHRAIISNRDAEHGMELWYYEPGKAGFHLLGDLWPGAESSGPGYFYSWKKGVIFRAKTQAHGTELWCTDGTEEGTRELSDINPGEADGEPYGYVAAGEYLFFRAHDSEHGHELWMTDGTPEGTRLAADIWKGPESSDPYNIVAHGRNLYFSARDGVHGEELWMLSIDDPANTVHLLGDLWPGPTGSEPISLNWSTGRFGIFVAKTGPEVSQLIQIEPLDAEGQKVQLTPVPLP
ncbi:MAG: protein kinase [Candidatus Hydrogenedentes bacterium]|nr:protein kinase [Candidatus Hydrogenedentota bacterium]